MKKVHLLLLGCTVYTLIGGCASEGNESKIMRPPNVKTRLEVVELDPELNLLISSKKLNFETYNQLSIDENIVLFSMVMDRLKQSEEKYKLLLNGEQDELARMMLYQVLPDLRIRIRGNWADLMRKKISDDPYSVQIIQSGKNPAVFDRIVSEMQKAIAEPDGDENIRVYLIQKCTYFLRDDRDWREVYLKRLFDSYENGFWTEKGRSEILYSIAETQTQNHDKLRDLSRVEQLLDKELAKAEQKNYSNAVKLRLYQAKLLILDRNDEPSEMLISAEADNLSKNYRKGEVYRKILEISDLQSLPDFDAQWLIDYKINYIRYAIDYDVVAAANSLLQAFNDSSLKNSNDRLPVSKLLEKLVAEEQHELYGKIINQYFYQLRKRMSVKEGVFARYEYNESAKSYARYLAATKRGEAELDEFLRQSRPYFNDKSFDELKNSCEKIYREYKKSKIFQKEAEELQIDRAAYDAFDRVYPGAMKNRNLWRKK